MQKKNYYQLSYIEEKLGKDLALTPNQQLIYDNRNPTTQQKSSFRIPLRKC